MHTQGGAYIRRCTHKAVHPQGSLWPPQESCYLRGHRQGGAHITPYTHKAVHTQGGVWPPQESCYLRGCGGGPPQRAKRAVCRVWRAAAKGSAVHTQGSAYIRWCTPKAVHTQGGLWPPQESCYLRGHRQGGAHITRCTHKAVHTQGGLWPLQESCYLRGVWGWASAASEASRLASAVSHSKGFGCADTRRCIHKAVHTQGGLWPPQIHVI